MLEMRSKTWFVAVMKGDQCLTAENLVGSRNYIGRLLEVCSILASNLTDLSQCKVLMSRVDMKGEEVLNSWAGELAPDDIAKFAHAYQMAQNECSEK